MNDTTHRQHPPRQTRSRQTRPAVERVCLLAAAVLSAFLATPGASAQTTIRIDASIVERPVIASGDDASQRINAFLDRHRPALTGSQPAAAARAIGQILQPLDNANASVAFRQAYSTALQPSLQQMAADESTTWRRLSALRIAGRLATETSAAFVENSLTARAQADRLFAITAIEMIFDAASDASPAVTPATLGRLVSKLGEGIASDSDSLRTDARVRALIAAANVPATRLPGVATRAKEELAERSAALLRDLPIEDADPTRLRAVLRAAAAISDRIRLPGQADAASATAAAALAGDMVAYALARGGADLMTFGDEESFDTRFVGVADNLARFADQRYAESRSTSPVFDRVSPLRDAVVAGDRSGFDANAIRLVQILTERPFSLPASRFER